MKYNMKEIMTRAWKIFRKGKVKVFGECLRRSWISAKAEPENRRRYEEAVREVGIIERVRTWYGWKMAGMEVVHGSKALFQVTMITGETEKGTYVQSYFGESQVAPVMA